MKKLLILLSFLLISQAALAKKFMIIHTNDLHSYFDGLSEQIGSYARVKTIIDQLKAEANDKNLKYLVMDGGDFGEGNSFFLSNDGVDSLKLLEMIGVEYAVIGNHDHMQGGKMLSTQITKANSKIKFLHLK